MENSKIIWQSSLEDDKRWRVLVLIQMVVLAVLSLEILRVLVTIAFGNEAMLFGFFKFRVLQGLELIFGFVFGLTCASYALVRLYYVLIRGTPSFLYESEEALQIYYSGSVLGLRATHKFKYKAIAWAKISDLFIVPRNRAQSVWELRLKRKNLPSIALGRCATAQEAQDLADLVYQSAEKHTISSV